jgi:RNA polymerase sigma-70 factor (ECF subfamily)
MAGKPDPTADAVRALLTAARAGDAQALGALLEQFRSYLLTVANGEWADPLHAKLGPSDVVQDTFLEAYRLFERFGGAQAEELRAWLRAILLNKLADARARFLATQKRAPQREQALDSERSPDLAGAGSTPSSQASKREQTAALLHALERLPEPYRQVVAWRQWDDLPFAEIGRRLGRSEGAARMLYVRALERLGGLLEPTHDPLVVPPPRSG